MGKVSFLRALFIAAIAVSGSLGHGCLNVLDRCGRAAPGDVLECPVPSWFDRAFTVHVPGGWDGARALPIVIAFHGGGGNRVAAETVTCPDGDADNDRCLAKVANARGYVVVRPDGTGTRPLRNVRTWNAGGGVDGWNCASGGACKSGVDDVRFFDDLLAEIERVVPVDRKRVYLTGLSNGAAISHRLACERSSVVAAIAAVGGTNQFAAVGGACAGGVAILQIHGTSDPCWTYSTTDRACAGLEGGRKQGAEESTEGWRVRNGCRDTFVDTPFPDANDGTRATRRVWDGCASAVEHVRIDGGGHTWPSGHAYLKEDTIGRVSHAVDGNAEILRFFDAH